MGAGACVIALALALLVFGAEPRHAAIAAAKGISLSLFVLTIVWTSVYLYNVLDRLKAIDSIGRSMTALAGDGLAQALIIGWGFSSFIQGITGFGVPVAVAAPLLIMLGFTPARAAAMALVGHGWAVTFGSMASSYYTIQLVTGIEGEVIAPHMALLFAPVIVASGALVAHIQGGLPAVGAQPAARRRRRNDHGGCDVRAGAGRRAADRVDRAGHTGHGGDGVAGPDAAASCRRRGPHRWERRATRSRTRNTP